MTTFMISTNMIFDNLLSVLCNIIIVMLVLHYVIPLFKRMLRTAACCNSVV